MSSCQDRVGQFSADLRELKKQLSSLWLCLTPPLWAFLKKKWTFNCGSALEIQKSYKESAAWPSPGFLCGQHSTSLWVTHCVPAGVSPPPRGDRSPPPDRSRRKRSLGGTARSCRKDQDWDWHPSSREPHRQPESHESVPSNFWAKMLSIIKRCNTRIQIKCDVRMETILELQGFKQCAFRAPFIRKLFKHLLL